MSMDTTREPSESVIVSAQVPAAARLELERLARAGYRTLSAEIRIAVAEHLERAAPDDEGETDE